MELMEDYLQEIMETLSFFLQLVTVTAVIPIMLILTVTIGALPLILVALATLATWPSIPSNAA